MTSPKDGFEVRSLSDRRAPRSRSHANSGRPTWIRVMGCARDVERAVRKLHEVFTVQDVSDPLPSRDGRIRVYLIVTDAAAAHGGAR